MTTGLPDGSTSLVYYKEQVDAVDPLKSDSDLTLPGWDASYTREELRAVVAEYNKMTEEDLWANLTYFLERIIPVAAECDVNMAIHEDDPCWSIFGLPRIITCEKNLDRFLKIVDDPHNGITLCTGLARMQRRKRCGAHGGKIRRDGPHPFRSRPQRRRAGKRF